MRTFYVYILSNTSRTLYVGMTNDLERRMFEHKMRRARGFASRYGIDQLVYFERFDGVHAAIEREKAIKGLLRLRKNELIESANPAWEDVSRDWFGVGSRFALPDQAPAAEARSFASLKDDDNGCSKDERR